MQRPLRKYFTAILFLVAFLLPRVADLHAFVHLSDDDVPVSCERCDITSHSQQFDLYLEDVPYSEEQPINSPSEQIISGIYNSPLAKIATPTSVYNKPPPLS
jgi:hypothetical protein